jgi:hypothetical protein
LKIENLLTSSLSSSVYEVLGLNCASNCAPISLNRDLAWWDNIRQHAGEDQVTGVMAGDQDELAIAERASRAYAKGGLRAALSRRIELRKQLGQRRYVDSGFVAYDYAALGDKDQAFYWPEKAYSEKAGSLGWIKVAKPMDSLRSDTRYIDLLKRMGLPQQLMSPLLEDVAPTPS